MLSKVIVIFAVVAVASSAPEPQAARYPAGVNPSLCPNFPICDNSLLHGTPPVAAAPQQQWQAPQQQWQAPQPQAWAAPANQWNPAPQSWNNINTHSQQWNQWDNSPALGPSTNDINGPGGDKYPAGINPAACPNYPYCDNGVAAASYVQPQVAPLPGYTSRQYPAGVSPAECPNFPYCN